MTDIMPIKVRAGFLRFPMRPDSRGSADPLIEWSKWLPVTAVMSIGDTAQRVQRVAVWGDEPLDPMACREVRYEESEPFDVCPIQVYNLTSPHAYTLIVAASMGDVLEACRMARG